MTLRKQRTGTHKFYHGKYLLVFYDKTGEEFRHSFDNVRDILRFMNRPITRTNVNLINVELYRTLKTETRFTKFLTGEVLTLYLIDISKN